MRKLTFLLIPLLLVCMSVVAAEKAPAPVEQKAESTSAEIYHVQVRVIFAGTTGMYGSVPRDLSDMHKILTRSFKYPSFELSNEIRLSLFSDEEVTALVFPEHYLKIIPRGTADGGEKLKVKAELYNIPEERARHLGISLGERPQRYHVGEVTGSNEKKQEFPIMSSAMLLNEDDWDAFGGVLVRVNTQGRVRSNVMSSSPLNSSGESNTLGQQKFLILGVRLEEK